MAEVTLNLNPAKFIRLGIIGMSEGNGHPYSWSAIFNGYDEKAMGRCPFPVIPEYLSKQTFPDDCIQGAKVTHIWTQSKAYSKDIATAAKINNIVDQYDEMIDKVDAILLARDDFESHLTMSKPFLNAGLPVYIDKPIAFSQKELEKILNLAQYPGQIFSCSALRYAKEFTLSTQEIMELGEIKHVEAIISRDWQKYGIHIVEPVLNILGLPGERAEVQTFSLNGKNIVLANWGNVTASFSTLGALPTPISIRLYGERMMKELIFKDTFFAFRRALQNFIAGIHQKKNRISFDELRSVVSILERGNNG